MKLHSSAFEDGGEIPSEYTCEGQDLTPQLTWSEAPEGTQSFALIVDDPDAPDPAAPKMTYVHWVVYNIPAEATEPVEGLDGLNDWKRTGYGGPCPPIGRHRYFFKLYALSEMLPDLRTPTKDQLLAAMEGKVLGQAEIIGTYEKIK